MVLHEVLDSASSRRGVLRTGVKVAYVTPLVLASMKAVPAFADSGSAVQADVSEEHSEDTVLLNSLTQLLGLGFSGTAAAIQAAVTVAHNALLLQEKAFQNLANAIGSAGAVATVTVPQVTIPGGNGLPPVVLGPYTFNDVPTALAAELSAAQSLDAALTVVAANAGTAAQGTAFAQLTAVQQNYNQVEDQAEQVFATLVGLPIL